MNVNSGCIRELHACHPQGRVRAEQLLNKEAGGFVVQFTDHNIFNIALLNS